MADNLVSKFTINSQGTDIDVKIKDADARNLIVQEISDRSELISKDTDGNTNVTSKTGDVAVSGKNITNNATGDVAVSGKNITNNATSNITNTATGISRNATTITDTATGDMALNVNGNLSFNTKNPIKYSQPISRLNDFFNIVPYVDNNGDRYNVLCDNGNTVNLSFGNLPTIVTAEENTDITDALNTALANGNAVIVGNAYKVSSPITIPSGHCLYGNGSKLTYVGSSTDEFVITVGNNENPTDSDKINKLGIFNITIECNYLANGIKISGVSANVLNANVYKAKSIGIKVYDGTNPSDANLVNIRVYNELDKPHILATGIELNGTDNMLRGIRTFGCLRSIVIKGGGNQLESIHALAFPSTVDGWLDSCGIDIKKGANIIHNAYFDNSRYGIFISSEYETSELSDLFYYCWETENTATRYVTFFSKLSSFAYVGDIFGQTGTGIIRLGLAENPIYQTGLIVKGNAENEPSYFKMSDHFFDGIFNQRRNYVVELLGNEKLLAIQNVQNLASHNVLYNIALDTLMISGLMIGDSGQILSPGTCSTTGVTIKTKKDSSGNVYVFITSGTAGVVSFISECNFILPRLTKNIPLPSLTDVYSHTY